MKQTFEIESTASCGCRKEDILSSGPGGCPFILLWFKLLNVQHFRKNLRKNITQNYPTIF